MTPPIIHLEKHYRTQPPQQIPQVKVPQLLEYLAFSGTPIYASVEKKPELFIKIEAPLHVIDTHENEFQLEWPQIKTKFDCPTTIELTFGYKRRRATLKTKIIHFENDVARLELPETVTLSNLRRNPRLSINPETKTHVRLKIHTSVGEVNLTKGHVFEISQLGISLFLDRNEGLILPGDRVERLEVIQGGTNVLTTSGVVSRVDMKRHSPELPQSYQAVVLFRNSERSLGEKARNSKRIPVLDNKPCFFSAEHPFFPGRRIEGHVIELSSSGLSCFLDKTPFPVIPGMRFQKCHLQIPNRPARDFVFDVVYVDFKSDGQNNSFRLGGEFHSASVELLKDISSYSQEVSGGLVKDASEEDFDLLWEFMFETNFIYHNKRKQIQSQSRQILETYHRLLSQDNPIIKKLIFKEDAEIKGHVSAVRFYDHAWVIQHLNALKASGSSAAQSVVQGIVDFFYDAKAQAKTDAFYVMSFYRPDNLYPAILFGETCRRMKDPLKSMYFDLSFGTYSEPQDPLGTKGLDLIRIDESESFLKLTNLLVERRLTAFLRAIGLGQKLGPELSVQKTYENLGLSRERHLLSLEEEDCKAFALVEMSSPGLNLSELTNSVYLFADGSSDEIIAVLLERLVEKAHELYFKPRDLTPVILMEPGRERPRNVAWSKIYTCWITSNQGVADFDRISKSVVADFRSLIAQSKNNHTNTGDDKVASGN